MTFKFLGKDIELIEFNIETADKIQSIMLGEADMSTGEVKVGMDSFNKAKYMTIEYGTADGSINVKYLKGLKAKQAKDVQELYEAIQELNGL